MATGAATLFVCARLLVDRRPARPADLILLSLSLAAALLSKLDPVFLILLAATTAFLSANHDASPTRSLTRRTTSSMLVVVPPLAALGAWWLRYGQGSPGAGNVIGVAVATAVMLLPKIPAPTIPARLAASASEASQRPVATFDDGVVLLAATAGPAVLAPGRDVSVELRWRVAAASARDFTVFLQLIDQSNRSRIAGFDSIPYESSFPPRLWQAGESVDEHRSLLVPSDLPPGRYSLVLGSYYHEGDQIRPIGVVPTGPSTNTVELMSWQLSPVASIPPVTR
jgi:hypothetical protein